MRVTSARVAAVSSLAITIVGSFFVRLSGAASGVMLGFFLSQLHRTGAGQSSEMAVGLLSGAFYLSELFGSPLAGFLIDRRGLRALLLAGPVLGIISTAIFASPTRLTLLIGARLLQGLTAACTIPAALAFLSDATRDGPGHRGRTMGLFEVASIGGIAAGYAAGGLLWELLHRPGFWLLAGIYGLALGLFVFVRTGTEPSERLARPTSLAALRLSTDLMPAWLAFNAAAGLWFGQAAYQLSGGHPRLHQLLTAGIPERQIGYIFGVYALLFAIGTVAWGAMLGKVRISTAMRVGAVGLLAATVALAGINHSDQLPAWAFGLCLALGLISLAGETAFTPAALTMLAGRSDAVRHGRGAVMGVYSMLLAGGQFIGAILGGVVAGSWGVDGLIGATAVLGIIGLLTLPRQQPTEPVPAVNEDARSPMTAASAT